jgi:hypothetical protein
MAEDAFFLSGDQVKRIDKALKVVESNRLGFPSEAETRLQTSDQNAVGKVSATVANDGSDPVKGKFKWWIAPDPNDSSSVPAELPTEYILWGDVYVPAGYQVGVGAWVVAQYIFGRWQLTYTDCANVQPIPLS